MSDVESMDPVPNRAARRAAERRGRRLGAAASAGVLASGTAAAVVGLFAGTAGALQTYVVDTPGDAGDNSCGAGSCTLRDAVEDANNDGEDSVINFAANITGTITLTTGPLEFDEAFDATVNGPGAGVLTVDGDDNSQILYAGQSFGANTLSISGLTFTNAYSNQTGGAIAFYNNNMGTGGNLVLTNMVITGNHAEYYGGGVAFYGGANDLTINNSTISNNTTDYSFGGGILFGRSNEFVMTNSTVSTNIAGQETDSDGDGGGIYMYGGDGGDANNATIANSTIANNTANGSGGGIALYGNDLTLLQATISGNTATDLGDGLYLASESVPASLGAREDRPARERGEGKDPKAAKVRDGVGVLAAGTVTINATIISANPGTNIDTGGDGATADSTESLIGAIGSAITLNDVSGTIRSDSPGLGALADNGGPTQTMALQTGSAAIDQGLTTVPSFTGSEFDQRGTGFARIVGGVSDIGAYEVQLVVMFTG